MTSFSKFPILRLPRVVFLEVFKCWNPYEIFIFSLVSTKTKNISIAIRKEPSELKCSFSPSKLTVHHVQFDESGSWKFGMYHISKTDEKNWYDKYLAMFSENLVEGYERMLDHLQDVFGSRISKMKFIRLSQWSEKELNSVLKWLNGYDKISKIPRVVINNERDENRFNFKIFMENFDKHIETLKIYSYSEDEDEKFKMNFNTKVDNFIMNSISEWISLDNLIQLDCKEVTAYTKLTNEDVNLFLKNWRDMKSNQRLELYLLKTKERLNWKTILNGLDYEIRDVRTVRRSKRCYKSQVFHFNGGIDIKRIDGKAVTIGMIFHIERDEDRVIGEKEIATYQQIFGNLDSEIQLEGDEDNAGLARRFELEEYELRSMFIAVW